MSEVLLAIGSDLPIKVLAVVGGTTVGAFAIGALVQIIVKLAFAQQVPRWPLWAVRTLGGGVSGWLVYLWLFGVGGGGLGGPGGWFGGGGAGTGEKDGKKATAKEKDKKARPTEKDKEKEKEKNKDSGKSAPAETLRIEVLGDPALMKIARSDKFDPAKRYRVTGEPGLLTLEDVRKQVLEKRKSKPPLRRLEVVVYLDSPAVDRPQVKDLVDWARDLDPERGRVMVDFSEPDRNAPID